VNVTFMVDEELLKVPDDVVPVDGVPVQVFGVGYLATSSLTLPLEEGVELDLVLPVDIIFDGQVEVGNVIVSRPHIPDTVEDFMVLRRLFQPKLVVRNTHDVENTLPIFLF